MSIDVDAFYPTSSYTISATAASSNTALTQPTGAAGGGGYSRIKVFNTSTTVAAYLSWGMTSQTASNTSPGIAAPNQWTTFEMGAPYTNLGVIMASAGTVTIFVMLGDGGGGGN